MPDSRDQTEHALMPRGPPLQATDTPLPATPAPSHASGPSPPSIAVAKETPGSPPSPAHEAKHIPSLAAPFFESFVPQQYLTGALGDPAVVAVAEAKLVHHPTNSRQLVHESSQQESGTASGVSYDGVPPSATRSGSPPVSPPVAVPIQAVAGITIDGAPDDALLAIQGRSGAPASEQRFVPGVPFAVLPPGHVTVGVPAEPPPLAMLAAQPHYSHGNGVNLVPSAALAGADVGLPVSISPAYGGFPYQHHPVFPSQLQWHRQGQQMPQMAESLAGPQLAGWAAQPQVTAALPAGASDVGETAGVSSRLASGNILWTSPHNASPVVSHIAPQTVNQTAPAQAVMQNIPQQLESKDMMKLADWTHSTANREKSTSASRAGVGSAVPWSDGVSHDGERTEDTDVMQLANPWNLEPSQEKEMMEAVAASRQAELARHITTSSASNEDRQLQDAMEASKAMELARQQEERDAQAAIEVSVDHDF